MGCVMNTVQSTLLLHRRSGHILIILMTLSCILAALVSGCAHESSKTQGISSAEAIQITNPFIEQRADPWVYRHSDGYYYFTATVPAYDKIVLRRARNLQDLAKAPEKTIWKKHAQGIMGAHIWAPEIHYINNKWHIYFAAGASDDVWAIRMYVLENSSENPLEGSWVEKGQIKTNWESFSLDATTFAHNDKRYLVWAQHDPRIGGNTNLYIAEMNKPWSIKGRQIMITTPEYDWERIGYQVNEGAAAIKRNGRLFISYSASATDHNYAMGLLTCSLYDDPLDASSWSKSPVPVFKSANGVYGPGHNSFTVSPDGTVDILVYHGRDFKEIAGDPLGDPNRHTRLQPLKWNDDGTPDFGEPVSNGPVWIE